MVGFDIESTGTDIETARIVTASMVHVGGGEETVERNWLINPGVPIPAEATEIHGITNEQAALGSDPREAIEEIISLLAEEASRCHAIVIYNARYDISLLDREARRYGIVPLSERVQAFIVDPLILDKELIRYRRGKGCRKLVRVCEAWNVPFGEEEAHSSSADALAATRLAWRLGKRNADKLEIALDDLYDQQRGWAEEQALDLQDYFDREGRDENVSIAWPLV